MPGGLRAETGMQPIDFQVQQRTAANAEHKGVRSALGVLTRIRRAERERGAAAVAPLIERDARAAELEAAAACDRARLIREGQ